ncbi:MmpS family transport accessory protein [Crossiella sp. NPDC003009]
MSEPNPYQSYQQTQVEQPSNGLGITGFVLGLVGLLLSWIPFIGVIAWPLVILGLIFSVIGLIRVNKGRANNKGMAIAGIAVSAIGLLVCIAWAAVFGAAFNQVSNEVERVAKVEYEVTGTATEVDITYGELGKSQQEKATSLPWTKQLENKGLIKGGSLMATSGPKGGTLTCKITVDGKVVATKTAEGALGVVSCIGT